MVLPARDGGLEVVPARVRIRDAHIVEVTREHEGSSATGSRSAPVGAEAATDATTAQIDLGDKLLAPAFVDAHTHLAMSAFRGRVAAEAHRGFVVEDLFFALEERLDAADVRAFTRMGAYEAMLHGVACVYDHYYEGAAVAQGLADVGLAGVVAPTLQDISGPGMDRFEDSLATTLELHANATLRSAGIFAALGPHATDTVSQRAWLKIAELSDKHGLPIHGHLAQSAREWDRAMERHGRSPSAFLSDLGLFRQAAGSLWAHGIWLSLRELPALRRGPNILVMCPASQAQFAFPADPMRWSSMQIPWALGSDTAASSDALSPSRQIVALSGVLASRVTHGSAYAAFHATGDSEFSEQIERSRTERAPALERELDPAQLFARTTSIPGAFHPLGQCGTIAVGQLAHLAIYDTDHPSLWPAISPVRALAYNAVEDALDGMIVSGRVVGTIGNFRASILADARFNDARDEATRRLSRFDDITAP